MRVSDCRVYLLHPTKPAGDDTDIYVSTKNVCLVRVETEDGLHGWGECYTQADRDTQIVAHVEQLKRYLIGTDATRIRAFTSSAFNDFAARRGSMDFFCALSGIEIALWDLAGKRASVPVYQLLGGAIRDKIRVYANGWSRSTSHAELADRARAIVERGFTALKFDPVPGPWRTFISREQEEEAAERVRIVRNAIGPDTELLIEIHRRLAPMHAIRLAGMIEQYRPYWFEEPVLAENIKALAAAKDKIQIPVVTGEELYTKFEFREVFERNAADIINPDVCNVGGIQELREIAAMAETYFVAVSPHNYNSTTAGLAATVQVSATMPNFLITEYFINFEKWGNEVTDPGLEVVDSYVPVPTKPGIGIDIDEEALTRHPYKQFPVRKF